MIKLDEHRSQKGFTLIEILLVIIIVSFMSAVAASVFLSYREKTNIFVTKQRLQTVQDSIRTFFEVNGRYPCPAPFNLTLDDANFGLEGNSHPLAPNRQSCRTGGGMIALPGTRNSAASPTIPPATTGVRHGAIPVRTLNLPDEFAVDAWNGLLTYAVSRQQATQNFTITGGFSHQAGVIQILDSNGNPLITNRRNDPAQPFFIRAPESRAHYIVLSHGRDQKGARALNSNNTNTRKNDCVPAELQSENCDDDSTFILTTSFSELEGNANTFDDLGVYEVQRRKDEILPAGTILPFDSASCPQGWSDYTPADGRFLIGVDPSGTGTPARRFNTVQATVTQYQRGGDTPTFAPSSADQGEYILGDMSEDGIENIPAYLALRYCAKQ